MCYHFCLCLSLFLFLSLSSLELAIILFSKMSRIEILAFLCWGTLSKLVPNTNLLLYAQASVTLIFISFCIPFLFFFSCLNFPFLLAVSLFLHSILIFYFLVNHSVFVSYFTSLNHNFSAGFFPPFLASLGFLFRICFLFWITPPFFTFSFLSSFSCSSCFYFAYLFSILIDFIFLFLLHSFFLFLLAFLYYFLLLVYCSD